MAGTRPDEADDGVRALLGVDCLLPLLDGRKVLTALREQAAAKPGEVGETLAEAIVHALRTDPRVVHPLLEVRSAAGAEVVPMALRALADAWDAESGAAPSASAAALAALLAGEKRRRPGGRAHPQARRARER